jgi:hypothetical protein
MRLSLLAAAVLCSSAIAQTNTVLGAPLNDPLWPGGSNKLDVQAIISAGAGRTVNRILGCARDRDGNYFVSASGILSTGNFHQLYELDKTGKYVKAHNTPAAYSATSVWGLRDLAYDMANHVIYGGLENAATGNKVYAFDVATRTFVSSKDWTAPAGSTLVRALAYNPLGDNGNGSMWTGNFGANLYEFRKDGTVIQSMAYNVIQKQGSGGIYGAAFNPVSKTIWWFSQLGSSRVSGSPGYAVVGIEMTTGNPATATGNTFFADITVPGAPMGGIAGGIQFSLKNGRPTLICTHQATSDTISEIYGVFNHGAGCDGPLYMNDEVPYSGNTKWGLKLTQSKASGGIAALFVSSGEVSIGMPSPPFGTGCTLLFSPFPPNVFFQVGPTASVVAGVANFPAPIPTGLGGIELRLQSVSVASGTLYLSDLGKTVIYN